jgi:hypothetical protein
MILVILFYPGYLEQISLIFIDFIIFRFQGWAGCACRGDMSLPCWPCPSAWSRLPPLHCMTRNGPVVTNSFLHLKSEAGFGRRIVKKGDRIRKGVEEESFLYLQNPRLGRGKKGSITLIW